MEYPSSFHCCGQHDNKGGLLFPHHLKWNRNTDELPRWGCHNGCGNPNILILSYLFPFADLNPPDPPPPPPTKFCYWSVLRTRMVLERTLERAKKWKVRLGREVRARIPVFGASRLASSRFRQFAFPFMNWKQKKTEKWQWVLFIIKLSKLYTIRVSLHELKETKQNKTKQNENTHTHKKTAL